MLLLSWKTFHSIDNLPSNIWEEKISNENVGLDPRFMRVVEKINSTDKFYYCLAFNEKEQIIGIAFFYTVSYDLIRNINRPIKQFFELLRKLYPSLLKISIGMTATFETYGSHFWYDSEVWNYEKFIESFLEHITKEDKKFQIIVLRDYIVNGDFKNENIQNQLNFNQHLGFVNAETFSIYKILFKQNLKPDGYINELKKKHRVYLRKIIRERVLADLKVEIIEDFITYLEDIYPLYVNVNQNAKEYHTDCLEKQFFLEIKKQFGKDTKVISIKNSEEKIMAFTLLINCQDTMIPYIIGLDYRYTRKFNLWYHCVWEAIVYSAQVNKKVVDLGATNSSMKRKLGAVSFPLNLSIRFRNNLLNKILKPILPTLAK